MKRDRHLAYTIRDAGSAGGSALLKRPELAASGLGFRRLSQTAHLLFRERVVGPPNLLDSGVTIHAAFKLEDGVTEQVRRPTLVCPDEGDGDAGDVSVLPDPSRADDKGQTPSAAIPTGREKTHRRQRAPDIAPARVAWIRKRYEQIHRGDTYDDLVRRAAFSRYDAGLLKDWGRAAGEAAKETLAGEKSP